MRGVFGRIHTAATAIVPNTKNVPASDSARNSSRIALFLSPALPNFVEFRGQAQSQRALRAQTIDQCFGLCQRGVCYFLSIEQLPPLGCHVTVVQHTPSFQLNEDLRFHDRIVSVRPGRSAHYSLCRRIPLWCVLMQTKTAAAGRFPAAAARASSGHAARRFI